MNETDIRTISVLGTGNMGPGLAILFARHNYPVTIWAHSPEGGEKAAADCRTIADDMVDAGLIDADDAKTIYRQVSVTEDLVAAVEKADFISESVVENLEVKQKLVGEIQRICPAHTIIASNTSTLLPSLIQVGAPAPENVLVAHFWNPAHLVPLVEVCGGADTDPAAVRITANLLVRAGKTPVVMKKEILGFIGNRLMHAMYREALSMVHDGIIDAEGIDNVVLSSFGPRFANLGPLEYLDYIGLDHIQRIQGYLYDDLNSDGGTTAEIDRLVAKGFLGTKSGAGLMDWSDKDVSDVRVRRDAECVRKLLRKVKDSD